jgi:hypothetical protein
MHFVLFFNTNSTIMSLWWLDWSVLVTLTKHVLSILTVKYKLIGITNIWNTYTFFCSWMWYWWNISSQHEGWNWEVMSKWCTNNIKALNSRTWLNDMSDVCLQYQLEFIKALISKPGWYIWCHLWYQFFQNNRDQLYSMSQISYVG